MTVDALLSEMPILYMCGAASAIWEYSRLEALCRFAIIFAGEVKLKVEHLSFYDP